MKIKVGRPYAVSKGTALKIRKLYTEGKTCRQLAVQFNIGTGTVHSIVKGSHCLVKDQPDITRNLTDYKTMRRRGII